MSGLALIGTKPRFVSIGVAVSFHAYANLVGSQGYMLLFNHD